MNDGRSVPGMDRETAMARVGGDADLLKEIAELFLELAQGGLAQGLSGAAAQGGQARAEGWEIRGMRHRAVYIPLY